MDLGFNPIVLPVAQGHRWSSIATFDHINNPSTAG
jgi:hypothetical protein